ncbi:hypothetical protein AB3X52_14415 [Nocardioides sp. DS6]|uniref:SdpI family protein n=1 Tax=Nocardioides eburneus TaxID=3231482 RepID=A0ABV3T0U1_9ACTN
MALYPLATHMYDAFGITMLVIVGLLFLPFSVVTSRAEHRSVRRSPSGSPSAPAKPSSSMEPGLLARKRLGIWYCIAVVILAGVSGLGAASDNSLPGTIACLFLAVGGLAAALRLRHQIRASERSPAHQP